MPRAARKLGKTEKNTFGLATVYQMSLYTYFRPQNQLKNTMIEETGGMLTPRLPVDPLWITVDFFFDLAALLQRKLTAKKSTVDPSIDSLGTVKLAITGS